MRAIARAALRAFLVGLVCACASSAGAAPPANFIVFDATAYAGKPDLAALGMRPLRGSGELWRPGQPRSDVDPIGVQRALECCTRSDGVFYLDVEHWPMYGQPDAVADRNMARLIRLAGEVRKAAPNLKFGYYGVLPEIVYWPIVSPAARDELDAWHRRNARAMEIARHVDVVFPSLYTFYDDVDGWETYARETLREARRYGKPVYAFLWPEFHDSNAQLRGRNLPGDFWRRELELCHRHADGLVIWGGWQRRWDDNAEWWLETQRFLESLRATGSP